MKEYKTDFSLKIYIKKFQYELLNTCMQNSDRNDLQHLKHHNIHMRRMCWSYLSSMNEYGILILSENLSARIMQCSTDNFVDSN